MPQMTVWVFAFEHSWVLNFVCDLSKLENRDRSWVFSLINFDNFVHLCNCRPKTRYRTFCHARKFAYAFFDSPYTPHNHLLIYVRLVSPVFEININEIIQHAFLRLASFTQHEFFWHTSIWLHVSIVFSSFFLSKQYDMGWIHQHLKLSSHS